MDKKNILLLLAITVCMSSALCGSVFADGETTTPPTPVFNVNIVEGSGTITQSGLETVITATSANIIAQGNLSTLTGEIVRIILLSTSNNALLRDTTGAVTYANGSYFCNGNLFMVNTNGFVFGAASSINAANIVVSTLNITNADFLEGCRAGRFNFAGQGSYIINQGKLIPEPGGYVCLLSQAISNKNTIQADLSSIILATGEKMTVVLDDLHTISVVIDEAVQHEVFGPEFDENGKPILDENGNIKNTKKFTSSIENSGKISANGGKVTLTAKVLNTIFDHAINNSGIIEANSVTDKDGVVTLSAEVVKAEGVAPADVKRSDILNTGIIEAGKVNILGTNTNFLNFGKVIAKNTPELPTVGDVFIKAVEVIQDGLISADRTVYIECEKIYTVQDPAEVDVSLPLPGPITIVTPDNPNPIGPPEAIIPVIQGPNVKIVASKIGTPQIPLNINAALTYIYRIAGDINILDSIGIGSSIFMTGPPDDNFAIVYNSDGDLVLEAGQGSVKISSNVTILARNLSLIAKTGINSTGSLIAVQVLSLLSEGPISSLGTLKADLLYERGASFVLGGVCEVRYADMKNADGAATMTTGTYSGTYSDPGDIDVADNAVITLGDNLTIEADSDHNGFGHFSMGTGSSIDGQNHNLTIKASEASTLRTISNVKTLILDESKSGSNPTYTAYNDISVNNDFTLRCVLALGADITIWTDFDAAGGGNLTMAAGSSIIGNNHDLTIKASSDSSFRSITGVKTLTVQESKAGSTPKYTLNNTVSVANLVVGSGCTVAIGGNTLNASGNVVNSGTITIGNGGTLDIDGDFTVGTLTCSGNNNKNIYVGGSWSGVTAFTSSHSTVTFDGSGIQNVTPNGYAFYNLTIASGTTTLGGAASVTNNLTVSSGATLNPNGNTVTGSGTTPMSVSGTIKVDAATFAGNYTGFNITLNAGSTVNYSGTIPQTINSSLIYSNLTTSGSGTKTLGGATTVNKDLTIGSGTTLDVDSTHSYSLTVGGNWINNGAFTARLGTVTFNGSGSQSISGSSSNVFKNLTVSNANGITLNSGTSVTGTLTLLNGAKFKITVTAAADTKTYDGTKSSSGVPTITSGMLLTGDTAAWTQTFNNENAGGGKTLTPAGSVSDGNGGNNYDVTFTSVTTGVITAKTLTITATGINKVYDGTAIAMVNLSDDRIAGDIFTCTYTAAFIDGNIGTNKTVNVANISISGVDAGNYTFSSTATAMADIIPTASITTQISPLTTSVVTPPDINQLVVYQGNALNPPPYQVYFYHPLTEVDISAFDALTVDADSYSFINGSLNLIGHDGLISMFDELNKKKGIVVNS